MGDVGTGLPTAADRGLSLKVIQAGGPALIADGLGADLIQDGAINSIQPAPNWYRVDFSWPPNAGKTGDFSASFTNLTTSSSGGTIGVTNYEFDSTLTEVKFGFGSLNDDVSFDNINVDIQGWLLR